MKLAVKLTMIVVTLKRAAAVHASIRASKEILAHELLNVLLKTTELPVLALLV
jgi:hypothetical protein